MTILPLIRRASIYLLMSTIAVVGINLIGVNQDEAYKVYLPLFVAIYVLLRWIDSKFNQSLTMKEPQDEKLEPGDAKGFAANSKTYLFRAPIRDLSRSIG